MAGGTPKAAFEEEEVEVLRKLISDYLVLLESKPDRPDPVLARLYPSASLEDEAVASSFRDLTVDDLEALKIRNARIALSCVRAAGSWEGEVTEEQQQAWVALLTDLRLVIGVSQGVTEEIMEMQLDFSEPSHRELFLLHYLGGLQESLIQAIQAAEAS